MNDINISFSKSDENPDVSVISVKGYVDTTTSTDLEESLKRLLGKGQFDIVIDLGDVNYISSAGWGIFVGEIKGVRAGNGDIKLASMRPDVREVFDLLEFNTLLTPYDSRGDALAAFEVDNRSELA